MSRSFLARVMAASLAAFVCMSFAGAADAALFETKKKKKTKPTVSLEQQLGELVDRLQPPIPKEAKKIEPIYFDLVVSGLCLDSLDKPELLASDKEKYEAVAREFADASERVTARATVLTVTVNPIDPGPGKEPIVVPLVAAANRKGEAKTNVSACNDTIARNIPAGRVVTMTFDSYTTSKRELRKFVEKIGLEIVALASAIAPLTGEPLVAGMTIGAISKAGTNIATPLENLVNFFIESKAVRPRSRGYTMRPDTRALVLASGRLKIIIQKSFKSSQMRLTNPINKLELPMAFDAAFGTGAMNKAMSTPAILGLLEKPVTDENFKTLCKELRFNIRQAGPAANYDIVAELFGLYSATFSNASYFNNSNRTCFTEADIKYLKEEGLNEEPHKGAYNFTQKPTEKIPDRPVRIEEFVPTNELLTRLAGVLKRAPYYLDPTKPEEIKASRADFAKILAPEMALAGESIDLLPERKAPNAEVVDYIIKWGAVTRFGCFRPPVSQTAIEQKVTAEALFLIPAKRILGVMQVGYDGTINRLNMMKVFRADEDYIKRLSAPDGKCGAAEGWEPLKDN